MIRYSFILSAWVLGNNITYISQFVTHKQHQCSYQHRTLHEKIIIEQLYMDRMVLDNVDVEKMTGSMESQNIL